MAYASAYDDLSYRSFRRQVQTHRAAPTRRQPAGASQDARSARDPKRRLLCVVERLPESSEAFVYAAMSRLMVRRLAVSENYQTVSQVAGDSPGRR